MGNEMLRIERELYPSAKAQQTLQDQQIASQFALQAMGNQDNFQQHQAILVEQTNPDKIVDNIMLGLQGKERNRDGGIIKTGEPVMNELGLNRIRFQLKSIINQSTILSHLEIEDIGRLMEQLSNNICDELALNWKEYGIVDKTLLDSISNSILVPAYLALKRAEGQNEKNWLGKISIENISNAPKIQQPRKEHWYDKFKL